MTVIQLENKLKIQSCFFKVQLFALKLIKISYQANLISG